MNKDQIKYKSFYDLSEGELYKDYIKNLGFQAKLHSIQNNLTELTGEIVQPEISVWVLKTELVEINSKIEQEIKKDTDFLKSHYLNDFDQGELKEILLNEEEWSYEDVIVAKILWKESGFNHNDLVSIKTENKKKLALGKDVSNLQLIIVTIALFLASNFINGGFALGIVGQGLYYKYDKVTDHEGNKHFTFNESVRSKGYLIFLFGELYLAAAIGFTIWAIYDVF